MDPEAAAPCRHAGAPSEEIIEAVSRVVRDLGGEEALLGRFGLTPKEYRDALPAAIERLRGSQSAGSVNREAFLVDLLQQLVHKGLVRSLTLPKRGEDKVYRLAVDGFGDVAIIKKGCPDGLHSSVKWSAPEWARETYLWWLCDSMRNEPGEHIVKGVTRLRKRFFDDYPDTLDGVVFHNDLCGTAARECPKSAHSIEVGGQQVPPPCVYVMPDSDADATEWNWDGGTRRRFPALLLSAFGIPEDRADLFIGHVGFQRRGESDRTVVTARSGPQRATTYRS